MPSDFIDRAKLEVAATEYVGGHHADPYDPGARRAFMAGVDAVLTLLDAETTEEWGVGYAEDGKPDQITDTATRARWFVRKASTPRDPLITFNRRVLYGPWLPSEGGEKP